MRWQNASGYHWRVLVEVDMGHPKWVIWDARRSRTDGRRTIEVAIVVDALNRTSKLGCLS